MDERELPNEERHAPEGDNLESHHRLHWVNGLLGVMFVLAVAGFFLAPKDLVKTEWLSLPIPNKFCYLVFLIVAPPLWYPVQYYLCAAKHQRDYYKTLGELWSPFWVATAGLCAAIYSQQGCK